MLQADRKTTNKNKGITPDTRVVRWTLFLNGETINEPNLFMSFSTPFIITGQLIRDGDHNECIIDTMPGQTPSILRR